jgi:glycine cleavage system H protein
VLEINPNLEANPESVNTDVYGSGWMIKISVDNPAELNDLLDSTAYKALIGH